MDKEELLNVILEKIRTMSDEDFYKFTQNKIELNKFIYICSNYIPADLAKNLTAERFSQFFSTYPRYTFGKLPKELQELFAKPDIGLHFISSFYKYLHDFTFKKPVSKSSTNNLNEGIILPLISTLRYIGETFLNSIFPEYLTEKSLHRNYGQKPILFLGKIFIDFLLIEKFATIIKNIQRQSLFPFNLQLIYLS